MIAVVVPNLATIRRAPIRTQTKELHEITQHTRRTHALANLSIEISTDALKPEILALAPNSGPPAPSLPVATATKRVT